MEFIQHSSNNRVLGAPEGVPIEECRALPVTDMMVDGRPVVASFWKPDANELAALNAGHPVILMIQGFTHAPVMVGVGVK